MENKLASEIIAGKFTEGDKIRIDGTGHAFTFEKITLWENEEPCQKDSVLIYPGLTIDSDIIKLLGYSERNKLFGLF